MNNFIILLYSISVKSMKKKHHINKNINEKDDTDFTLNSIYIKFE